MAAKEVSTQEIDVEELNVTSAVLMGAAHHYGNHCKTKNDAFMQCRTESKDPRKCLKEGKEVKINGVDPNNMLVGSMRLFNTSIRYIYIICSHFFHPHR